MKKEERYSFVLFRWLREEEGELASQCERRGKESVPDCWVSGNRTRTRRFSRAVSIPTFPSRAINFVLSENRKASEAKLEGRNEETHRISP